MTNCWICGKLADSAEHKIKKSDIVKITGTGSWKKGEFLLYQDDSFIPLQGPNSKLVKYNKILCSSCNNNFTQPFDKAYECFINYICENRDLILNQRFVDFKKVYGDNFANGQRNLYKYLVKSFGCRLAYCNSQIPTDLSRLLYQESFKTQLRISFAVNEDKFLHESFEKMVGNGDLYAGFESKKTLSFPRKLFSMIDSSILCIYEYSEYFGWLHIFYWYNSLPDGDFGNSWIANSQHIYLGSFYPFSDEKREKILERIKSEENVDSLDIQE
jgi:hypothetical protein